ncbi:MAG: precorrin-3B C(17)-methyltransferase, partial [Alphaproteobacteria bacterium]|nr:precorrin-3B C(17)-methyltransferase [Alphaproteobacteria bacterium]
SSSDRTQYVMADHLGDHERVLEALAACIRDTVVTLAAMPNAPKGATGDPAPTLAPPDTTPLMLEPAPVIPGLDLPHGWRVANAQAATQAIAALDAGAPLALTVEAGDAGWLMTGGLILDRDATVGITVSYRTQRLGLDRLVLHPPVLALGIDCPYDARAEEVEIEVQDIFKRDGLALDAVAVIVAANTIAGAHALGALADRLAVPLRYFDAATLEKQSPRSTDATAEAAALAGAGRTAKLVTGQDGSRLIACAVALGPEIDGAAVGRPQGQLVIVGTGPGDAGFRAPNGDAALAAADHLVGYSAHLDALAELAAGKTRHAFPKSEELQRCRKALDLASRGNMVALIAAGDPGIFETASLIWELVEEAPEQWARVAIDVIPGISAMQWVAARTGAPLGSDFCAISLSDLTTPWKQIELRLAAAAAADFVVALHNPVSRRRSKSFDRAKQILLTSRPADTPVVVARNIGRDDEDISVTTLAELNRAGLNMGSIILVGTSSTKVVDFGGKPRVFTPRGYGPVPGSVPDAAE